MRRTIIRMISSNSLSAFSASATEALQRERPVVAASASRSPSLSQSSSASSAVTNLPLKAGQLPASNLPRGSLLNLSV